MYRRIFLLFFVFCSLNANAQIQVVKLSLQDAVERFSTCNLHLIAERYNIDMAEAQVIQAKLFENPVLTLEQNVYNRNNGKYFDVGPEGEAVVGIEQLIYIAGQRNNRIKLEKINKEMATYQFEEVLRTLRNELKTKFIDLYYSRKSLIVYDKEISYIKKLLEVYKDQNEKGNISLLEKSRIEALLLSLSQERNTADNEIVALQGDLKLLLGLSNDESFEPLLDENVLGKIDTRVVSFAELNDRMSVRPDMKLIQAGIRVSQADVKLQKSLAFPEVSVTGSFDRAGNFCNKYFAIGVNVSIPIFNRNQGNIKAARLSVLQNSNRELYARQQAENELFTAYTRLEKALTIYHSSNDELEKNFTIIIEGVNSSFQKRNISLLEFVDYYQSYKETCLQLYETRKNVLMAVESINTVTGSDVFKY